MFVTWNRCTRPYCVPSKKAAYNLSRVSGSVVMVRAVMRNTVSTIDRPVSSSTAMLLVCIITTQTADVMCYKMIANECMVFLHTPDPKPLHRLSISCSAYWHGKLQRSSRPFWSTRAGKLTEDNRGFNQFVENEWWYITGEFEKIYWALVHNCWPVSNILYTTVSVV